MSGTFTNMVVRDDETATEETLARDIVALAKASALHERIGRISEWVNLGYVNVERSHGDQPRYKITFAGQEWFEHKDDFPTVGLVANIALAIKCGATDMDLVTALERRQARVLQETMLYGYGGARINSARPVWMDEFCEIKEDAYAKVAALTAPVTRGRK